MAWLVQGSQPLAPPNLGSQQPCWLMITCNSTGECPDGLHTDTGSICSDRHINQKKKKSFNTNLYFLGAFNLDEFIHSPSKCNSGIFFSEFLSWDMKVTREKTGLGGISPH